MESYSTDADAAAPPFTHFEGCDVPLDQWPPTLAAVVDVWGRSVGVDSSSAAAITLTLAGGIAGNSVRVSACGLGEVGANLQIAMVRDTAPDLRRGIQRLIHAFDLQILDTLDRYPHLTDARSQRNELARMESQYNAILKEWQARHELVNNERAAESATFSGDFERIDREYRTLTEMKNQLQQQLCALRFRMRPMVMVPELGIAELEQLDTHATDRAILELATDPCYLRRLAHLNERALSRLAAFRRNAEWSSRLEYAKGRYQPRAALSTLLLAEQDELLRAWVDPVLVESGFLDPFLVCSPGIAGVELKSTHDPGGPWAQLVSRWFEQRLDGKPQDFKFSDEALTAFQSIQASLRRAEVPDNAMATRMWRENGPVIIAKLALCVALFRDASGCVVEAADVHIAEWVGRKLLDDTARHWSAVQAERMDHTQSAPASKHVTIEQDPVTRMVQKLRKLAPCSARTLFRSYSDQDYQQLRPILERAIELGLIQETGKQLSIVAPDLQAVSVSTSVCP